MSFCGRKTFPPSKQGPVEWVPVRHATTAASMMTSPFASSGSTWKPGGWVQTIKDNQHYPGVFCLFVFTASLKFVSWSRNGKRYKSSNCWNGRVEKLRGLYLCLLKIWWKGKEMDLAGLKLLTETSNPYCTQRFTHSASLVLYHHTQNKEILEAS